MYVCMYVCIVFLSALLCGQDGVHVQHFAARHGVRQLAPRLDQEVTAFSYCMYVCMYVYEYGMPIYRPDYVESFSALCAFSCVHTYI